MNNDDSSMVRLTWDEAQEMLRPATEPTGVVMIDGFEFEEYEVVLFYASVGFFIILFL